MTSLAHPKPLRAALYARSATEGQGEPRTVDRQIEKLRDYCRANGLTIAGEHVDPAVSGLTRLDERVAGRELLAAADARRFDVVLVYDPDRLARSGSALVAAVRSLAGQGIEVRAAIGDIDLRMTTVWEPHR